MSASTVSITANPSARRRPVVVGDKKSGIELVATDGVAAATSDKISNGKDLSHSIRGEVVLERPRDVVQVKKALPNSDTALPSRRTNRKGVSKTQKPLWQTIISVFTKNFLLLLVLLGLAQMIRRLLANPGTISPMTSSTQFERRIAEVEALLVTTTKMMRVEVDLVDQKILNQIGGLRTELNKKIEDKDVELETGLKNLEDRTVSLENSLGELKATEWLSKEEFVKFLNEFKKAKGLDHGYTDLNLDEMRAFAREIVEKEFEKHSADGLGRVDYALASGGAMIVKHSEPYTVGKAGNWFYTANRNGVHNDAEKMLSPSFGEPGHCFPLKGNSGFVQIKLRTAIVAEAVTLEHVAKSVAYDRSSAPKDCRVSGWLQQGRDLIDQAVHTENMFVLSEFTYDLDKSHAQTFNVLGSSASSVVNMIRLDFTSNHGSPSHTCIYRLRVHGYEPNSVSMLAI